MNTVSGPVYAVRGVWPAAAPTKSVDTNFQRFEVLHGVFVTSMEMIAFESDGY